MDFDGLYEKYASTVRRFALFLCGNVAMADDITADTFLRALQAGKPIREPTVKSYLFTIARNVYRDLQRRSRTRDAPVEQEPQPEIGTLAHLEQKQQLSAVLAALKDLPEIDRAALLMRAVDDMPYEEIAAVLEISVTAAKVKVHRARAKLMETRNPRREKLVGSGEKR